MMFLFPSISHTAGQLQLSHSDRELHLLTRHQTLTTSITQHPFAHAASCRPAEELQGFGLWPLLYRFADTRRQKGACCLKVGQPMVKILSRGLALLCFPHSSLSVCLSLYSLSLRWKSSTKKVRGRSSSSYVFTGRTFEKLNIACIVTSALISLYFIWVNIC